MCKRQQPSPVTNDDHHNHDSQHIGVAYPDGADRSDRKGTDTHRRKLVRTASVSSARTDRTPRGSPPPPVMPALRARVVALIVVGAVTAGCGGNGGHQAPPTTTSTTTSPQSSTAAPSPTEKSISPTGGNAFTPAIKAPPAPTVPAGRHPGRNGIP